jgi:negative regulator of sigma E activity
MAALQQEQQEAFEHPKVVLLESRRQPVSQPPVARPRWRSLVPLSAAAGIAAAVLFFGQPLSRQAEPQAVAAVAPAVQASDVAEVRWSAPERSGDASQPLNAASAEVLNGYLMEHSNTLAERSMGGAISNARFVVNTTGYSADGE